MIINTVFTNIKIRHNKVAGDWLGQKSCSSFTCVMKMIHRLRLGHSTISLVPSSMIGRACDARSEDIVAVLFSSTLSTGEGDPTACGSLPVWHASFGHLVAD